MNEFSGGSRRAEMRAGTNAAPEKKDRRPVLENLRGDDETLLKESLGPLEGRLLSKDQLQALWAQLNKADTRGRHYHLARDIEEQNLLAYGLPIRVARLDGTLGYDVPFIYFSFEKQRFVLKIRSLDSLPWHANARAVVWP